MQIEFPCIFFSDSAPHNVDLDSRINSSHSGRNQCSNYSKNSGSGTSAMGFDLLLKQAKAGIDVRGRNKQ